MKNRERDLLSRLEIGDLAERDERSLVYLPPVRVLWERSVENSEALLRQRRRQISLTRGEVCALRGTEEGAAILLDFGRELHGGIEITVHSVEGAESARLRVRFGESASEAMSELGGTTNATNDHARRDVTVEVGMLSMNTVGMTGFRFVRIDLLTPGAILYVHTVKAMLIYRDLPYLGSFECSDALLNRIWNTGAYTVHLNMQHYIWDGIKRDRLVWIGDLHPEVSTILTVFGDQKIIRDSLDYVVEETPEGEWMNGIPSYSMWWIILQYEYFMFSGNRAYLEAQLPCLRKLCDMLNRHIDPEGRDVTPEFRFIDWPTKGNDRAVDLGLQALHVIACRFAKRIFEALGQTEDGKVCQEALERLERCRVQPVKVKQADALAALAGLLPLDVVNETSLKPGGTAGMTCFMGYYILMARALAGDVPGALSTLREYWGGMLALGATTFWEDFDIQWMKGAAPIDRLPREGELDVHGGYGRHCYKGFRHSLCHGWASGPTAWLTRFVLGVEILEPGCGRIRVKANLCDLDWARGTLPTPKGILAISHRRKPDGSIQTEVDAPEGVEVVYG